MNTFQHKTLAEGKWFQLSFFEQMANIGSEVIRAINWREKKNPEYSKMAFERALELLWLTAEDKKNSCRLKEVLRNYETVVDFFYGQNIYNTQKKQLEQYFFAFTYAARANH